MGTRVELRNGGIEGNVEGLRMGAELTVVADETEATLEVVAAAAAVVVAAAVVEAAAEAAVVAEEPEEAVYKAGPGMS